MIGTSRFIQYEVPIKITFHPIVEVPDHVPPISFPGIPGAQMHAPLLTALRKQQMLIREKFMNLAYLCEILAYIPMDTCPPYIFGRFRIAEHCGSTFDHKITVMIPDQNMYMFQPFPMHNRT
ncbi:hypothetical protein D3C78_933350 [compost metagenome]